MANVINGLLTAQDTYSNVLVGILRYGAPVLAFILLLRCLKPLLTFRREPEIWAWLCLNDGTKLPITHWENVIGRSSTISWKLTKLIRLLTQSNKPAMPSRLPGWHILFSER